jgi:hypothetical protein
MSTQTRERNYVKHPHTARFLQTFHAATYGLASDIEPAQNDLLDLVPVDAVADLRSPAQAELMERLVRQITELDGEAGAKARAFQDGITERGTWTPGRTGNASEWISRMIAKVSELKAAAKVAAPPVTPAAEVADGRYAVEEDGALKFFHVRNGKANTRWAGFVFVDIQASDDTYPLKDRARKARVLASIAADLEAASRRYGQELGVCGRCGRTLTDEESRAYGIGPVCRDK